MRIRNALKNLCGRFLLIAFFGLVVALSICGQSGSSRADDVNITTSTNNGILLDSFTGTTAQIAAGVAVSNTTFTIHCNTFPAICATTQPWTLTNNGTLGYTLFKDGGSVINFGSISAVTNSIWIQGGTSAVVDNKFGATISGAIVLGENDPVVGTVINAGTITNTDQAIGLWNGGTVTNLATGVIQSHGGSNAVAVVLGTSRVVDNYGLIQSNDSGYGTGVSLQSGTLTNYSGGQILGAYNGVWTYTGASTITNAGYIEASKAQGGGSAIEVDAGGTIVNSGTIKSLTSNGTTTDAGISFTGAGSVTNSGTIMSATGGLAIQFNGSAAHTLTLDTGSILGGNVRGGTGADGLVLKGIGTESAAKFLAFETLSMQGTEWNLTGSGNFSTSADVQSGLLHVNGSLTVPTMTVASGGTLGGNGMIVASGGVTVNGTIAPGNSIGTLNITGPYTQAAGSTYQVELNAAGQSDLINVTGAATINGGTVRVVAAPGAYGIGQHYIILSASGGVTGQYASVVDNTPFIDFQLGKDANDIFLDTVQNAVLFQDVAVTRNQKAAAGALQGLGAGNPVFDAALLLDVPNALHAFDLLSGEIHAAVRGVLLDESRFPRDAVIGRLRQSMGGISSIFAPQFATLNYAEDSGFPESHARTAVERVLAAKAPSAMGGSYVTSWGHVFGNWGNSDSDGNAASYNRRTAGFITGLDRTVADMRGDLWRFGFAGGYQRTSVNVADRSSSGDIDTYHFAAYAGRQQGPLGVRTGAAFSWHDINSSRTIFFPGFFDTAKAGYSANTAQVFGEVGYGWTVDRFAFEPFAALAYVNLHTGGFAEGGGAAALTGAGGNVGSAFSTLGLRAAVPLPWAPALMAKGSLGWRYAFGTITPTAELAFASSATEFVVAGLPIARNAAVMELGLDGEVLPGTTIGITYSSQFASASQDQSFRINLMRRF